MSAQPLIIRQLTEQHLPVFSQSVRALNQAWSAPVLNWKTVADIILKDPGLVLQTLFLLKSGSKRMAGMEVTDMSQAVMLLGLERVKQLATGLPVLEEILSGFALEKYYKAVNRAYHGACQARNWAQWRNDFSPCEIYIATLLHSIPELALWISEPDKMQQLRRLVYKDGMSPDEAHHITLGNSLQHYGRMVTSDLALPEFVHDVLCPENSNLPRVQLVLRAVELANNVEFGWYTDGVTSILNMVAESVNKSLDETIKIVHGMAIQVAHDSPFKSVTTAAALIALIPDDGTGLIDEEFPEQGGNESAVKGLSQPDKTKTDSDNQSEEKVSRAGTGSVTLSARPEQHRTKPVSEAGQTGKSSAVCFNPQHALFTSAVKALEEGMGKMNASEIIRCAVHGMHDGAGLHRVVFAAQAPRRAFMEARFLVGTDNDPAFSKFQIKLDNINLFSRLLEKPNSVWINDENRHKYWQSVPDVFKVLIKTNSFCAMSVHVDSKPIGLFYADRHSPDCKIDKQTFSMFRHIGLLATKCLSARPVKK